jgi:hypothetical protein
MSDAIRRKTSQNAASIRCKTGPNFRDFRDFRDFTTHKEESFSSYGGTGGSEVWEVSEDRAETDLSPRCLDSSQTDASRVIRDARACGTSLRCSMTVGR